MPDKFLYRSQEIEIMDDLSSGGPVMDQTLKELEVINTWLGGNYVTINGLEKLTTKEKQRRYTIVDIGCGGGDMLKLIAKWANKKNFEVELIGVDANPHVISFATQNTSNYKNISYKTINIFSEEFSSLKADIFVATLFTHHFDNKQLINLLKNLKAQSSAGIVINDLHRHWFAYYSIKALTSLFSKSAMVRNDAAISVLRSFKKSELKEILANVKGATYTLHWYWAFRWQVVLR